MNLLPTLLFLPALTHSFSLDTHTKHWNYTTSNLASTTSAKCQSAYAADIKCDGFLVDLVAAHETRTYLKDMQPGDFTSMCSSTCESSLAEYIDNVRDACTEPGDAAVKAKGYMWLNGTENVPVETVGLMFQYMLVRGCARDEHGENCYITQSAFLPPDFDCDWTCALAYYWTAHVYPYSDWTFGDPELKDFSKKENDVVVGSNYMMQGALGNSIDMLEEGWRTVKKCKSVGSKEKPPFDEGISGKDEKGDKKSAKGSSSGGSSMATSTATASSAASTEAGNGTAAAASPTETGAAGRVDLVMGYCLGAVVLVGFLGF